MKPDFEVSKNSADLYNFRFRGDTDPHEANYELEEGVDDRANRGRRAVPVPRPATYDGDALA